MSMALNRSVSEAADAHGPAAVAGSAGALHRAARLAPVALAAAVSVAVCVAFFGFTADDTLIVARYARNLVAGNGLVFNPGEQVSALTSPFHALVLSVLTLVSGAPTTLYKALSAGLVIGTLGWMSLRLFATDVERLLFLVLTAASPFVLLWTVGGLETPLLLCVLAVFHARSWRMDAAADDRDPSVAIYVLAALAFLIRHDSALLTAPVVASQMLACRHSARHWLALSAAALGPIGWLAFAWLQYGDLLPTSFYLKTPGFGLGMLWGALYLFSLAVLSGVWLVLLPAGRSAGGPAGRGAGILRANLPVLIGLGLFLVYGMAAGTKHMMFSYRLFVPVIPVMVLAAMAIGRPVAGAARAAALLAAAAVLQAGLAVYLHTTSLNPTVLHVFGPAASRVFEYPQVTLANYAEEFLPAMRRNALDTRAHWQELGRDGRVPRVHTFGAGVLPFHYGEAYVLDSLAGYRHDCDYDWPDWRRAADYMHVMWPMHGSLEDQLGPLLDRSELVSRQVIAFDGRTQHLDVYYNPRPEPKRQSDRVDRPCGPSPGGVEGIR